MSNDLPPRDSPRHYSWIDILIAGGTLLSAIAAAVATGFAWRTVHSSERDARDNRAQELLLAQGRAMSACMSEYYQIVHEANIDWRTADAQTRTNVLDLYSKRIYGLHFEEYHLFRQHLIPRHVYALWVAALKQELARTDESELPRLHLEEFFKKKADPDFDGFLEKALQTDEIEPLVSDELRLESVY